MTADLRAQLALAAELHPDSSAAVLLDALDQVPMVHCAACGQTLEPDDHAPVCVPCRHLIEGDPDGRVGSPPPGVPVPRVAERMQSREAAPTLIVQTIDGTRRIR